VVWPGTVVSADITDAVATPTGTIEIEAAR
jgi:hypothetical protein